MCGPHQWGLFPEVKEQEREVDHSLLMPRLRMSGTIYVPSYALMVCGEKDTV
jgi:hypothetical protein